MRAFSFGHLLKTVELVEEKISFFWSSSTENGRLRRLKITFYKSPFFHDSFGHSVFGSVDFREILGSSENGRDTRLRKSSAPEV